MSASGQEVDIHSLTAGGDGVGRLDGRVIFVPGAVTGDRVQVQIVEQHKRYLRGRVLQRVKDSPLRRPAPCPYAERCGGCPWMALDDQAQLDARQALVRDALVRVGGLTIPELRPTVAAPSPLGYRNRLRLHALKRSIGFYQPGTRTIVDITACAVADPQLNQLLKAVRSHLQRMPPLSEPLQLELAITVDGYLQLAVSGPAALQFKQFSPTPLELDQLQLDDRPLDARGAPRLPFSQANHAQNARLVEAAWAALETTPESRVLDLFCGDGNFSLPHALDVHEVIGIEYSTEAIKRANARAPANAFYYAGDALARLQELFQRGERFDRMLLDPPRDGAREVCRKLLDHPPARLVYVSCDPATLARDLRILVDGGMTLQWVQPFDLMPQTAHVETLAVVSGPPSP